MLKRRPLRAGIGSKLNPSGESRVINRLQPFSGVLIATIGATKPTIPAFSRGKHRSTEPKAFHHLKTQGFWNAFTEHGTPSSHKSVTQYVIPNSEFAAACADSSFRELARRVLIAKHFKEPAERNALYNLVGMEVPTDDQIAKDASYETPRDAEIVGRDGRFRLDVVPAYDYTCALTGYRITTIAGVSIVDAAHIHEFSDSRNNDPRNGLALCKNAHWLFDATTVRL